MAKRTFITEMAGPGKAPAVRARWVFMTRLVLTSAAHFGGEGDGSVDMPLLRDARDGRPLLPGSSLAGVLRSYLCDRCHSYEGAEPADGFIGGVFGPRDMSHQSPLTVFDAWGELPADQGIPVRDGVKINASTGAAEKHKKFDVEVLPPGTSFVLRCDLEIGSDPGQEPERVAGLLAALGGLGDGGDREGEIRLGARTSSGQGMCRAEPWQARRFDLSTRAGWLAWALSDHRNPAGFPNAARAQDAVQGAGLSLPKVDDHRRRVRVELDLACPDTLLISAPNPDAEGPDVAHLRFGSCLVLSGPSLKGVLRGHLRKVAGDFFSRVPAPCGATDRASRLLNDLCGPELDGTLGRFDARRSRLTVPEVALADAIEVQETGIALDRLTGGVMKGAMEDSQPVVGSRARCVLEVRNPSAAEVGLLALALKDLVSGALPLGGDSGSGRGVLWGEALFTGLKHVGASSASVRMACPPPARDGGGPPGVPRRLDVSDADRAVLQGFVDALRRWPEEAKEAQH